jgi:hypothetical protein
MVSLHCHAQISVVISVLGMVLHYLLSISIDHPREKYYHQIH